jgi:hypothetical protein
MVRLNKVCFIDAVAWMSHSAGRGFAFPGQELLLVPNKSLIACIATAKSEYSTL